MKDINVKKIIELCEAKLICGDENMICTTFSKDTRTLKQGDTYIGIAGETFDGSKFWDKALENGAQCCIIENIDFEKEDLNKYKNKTIIKVKNTLEALYKIASYKRSLYNIPIIAVTGSVGKTSTKDIIASVLSTKYKTLKTKANYNNNIGVPFTLLELQDHEVAVIEMGMNHLGEIKLLSKIAKPTISVITNVGTAHIGNLGSQENILKAKLEILEGMETPNIIINNDNELLNKWSRENTCNITTFGIEQVSNAIAKNISINENISKFKCIYNNEEIDIEIPIGGKHFIYNALCAICVAKKIGIENEKIKEGIKNFELTQKRIDITKKEDIIIINDSYNASYESMKSSIEYLARNCKKKKNSYIRRHV